MGQDTFSRNDEFVSSCKRLWPELLLSGSSIESPISQPEISGCATANLVLASTTANRISASASTDLVLASASANRDRMSNSWLSTKELLDIGKTSAEHSCLNLTNEIEGLKKQARDIYVQLSYLLRYWELREESLAKERVFSKKHPSTSCDQVPPCIEGLQQMVHFCDAKRALELNSSKIVQALFCKGAKLKEGSEQRELWRSVAKCHLGFQKVLSAIAQHESRALSLNCPPSSSYPNST